MKIVKRVGLITLIALIAIFGTVLVIENRNPTAISLWFFESTELPLVVWLFVCFALGLLVGTIASLLLTLRWHRNVADRQNSSSPLAE